MHICSVRLLSSTAKPASRRVDRCILRDWRAHLLNQDAQQRQRQLAHRQRFGTAEWDFGLRVQTKWLEVNADGRVRLGSSPTVPKTVAWPGGAWSSPHGAPRGRNHPACCRSQDEHGQVPHSAPGAAWPGSTTRCPGRTAQALPAAATRDFRPCTKTSSSAGRANARTGTMRAPAACPMNTMTNPSRVSTFVMAV